MSATWVTFQQKYLKVMVHCFETWWLNDFSFCFYNEPCHFKFRLFTNFSFLEIYDPQRELRIWFSILSNWNFCKGIHIFFPRTKLVDSRNKEQNRVNFEPFSFCHSAIWKWSILKHVYIMLCLTHNLNLTADPTDESRTQTCLSLRFLLFIHSRCIK